MTTFLALWVVLGLGYAWGHWSGRRMRSATQALDITTAEARAERPPKRQELN